MSGSYHHRIHIVNPPVNSPVNNQTSFQSISQARPHHPSPDSSLQVNIPTLNPHRLSPRQQTSQRPQVNSANHLGTPHLPSLESTSQANNLVPTTLFNNESISTRTNYVNPSVNRPVNGLMSTQPIHQASPHQPNPESTSQANNLVPTSQSSHESQCHVNTLKPTHPKSPVYNHM